VANAGILPKVHHGSSSFGMVDNYSAERVTDLDKQIEMIIIAVFDHF